MFYQNRVEEEKVAEELQSFFVGTGRDLSESCTGNRSRKVCLNQDLQDELIYRIRHCSITHSCFIVQAIAWTGCDLSLQGVIASWQYEDNFNSTLITPMPQV